MLKAKLKGFYMKQENKEMMAGVFLSILLGFILLFLHAQKVSDKRPSSFTLYGQFTKADGLMNGAEVRLAGIKVGEVVSQSLNGQYAVKVGMSFPKYVELSTDTSAVIETDGLLGSKHVELVPGGDDELLKSGDSILYTQDALILTELMDKVNAFMREKKKNELTATDEEQLEDPDAGDLL